MRGREIYSTLSSLRTDEHRFVNWWRKENDFLDYDLIDRFIDNAETSEEIDGFSLLTMEEMWDEVKRIGGNRVNVLHDAKGDQVEWLHSDKSGLHKEVCVYTPETVMHIFDVETRGNPVGV
jgi:hypothetical protein